MVLAIAQFRHVLDGAMLQLFLCSCSYCATSPEKNHALMLDAFAAYLARDDAVAGATLVLAGGCRDDGDAARLAALRARAATLGIQVRAAPGGRVGRG
jgi:hypothetical protein